VVCDKLIAARDCNDWVVTTAFYASLHLITASLFPLVTRGTRYKDFSSYYRSLPAGSRGTPHDVRIELAHQFTSVGGIYEGLYDRCKDARYLDYRIPQTTANKCREDLEAIEKVLTK
jgi:hypothetical protein